MFGFLDSIPGVGHVKGAIHYAVGDDTGGRNAMLQATKSTAMLTGGAVGAAIGGPIGMVSGAAFVAAATDSMSSKHTQEPWGCDAGVTAHMASVTEMKRLKATGMDHTSMVKRVVPTSKVKPEVVLISKVKTV
ncbi:uncharacterized protein [Maniola hyperantus]|uniref:uncharacterized protein n=1 Tax=Aphantopus hyperantus TaxID=2795564 RepID=UPI00213AC405